MGELFTVHQKSLAPIVTRSGNVPLRQLVSERLGREGYPTLVKDVQFVTVAVNTNLEALAHSEPSTAALLRAAELSLSLDPSAVGVLEILQNMRKIAHGPKSDEALDSERGNKRYKALYEEAVRLGARPDRGRVGGVLRALVLTEMVVVGANLFRRAMTGTQK